MEDKPTDHDLLIRLDEKTDAIKEESKTIKTMLCNHLSHHFRATLVVAGTMLSIIAALVIFIVTN